MALFPFSDERVVRQLFRQISQKELLAGRMTTVPLTQPNLVGTLTHSPEYRNSLFYEMLGWFWNTRQRKKSRNEEQ
jgi:hypothetical protein